MWSILCIEQCVAPTVVSTDLVEVYFALKSDACDGARERVHEFRTKTDTSGSDVAPSTRHGATKWEVHDDASQSTLTVFLRSHPHPESVHVRSATFYAQLWETIQPSSHESW